ncbi:MAG: 1-deoxy-D-xylulose-5-phosphate reductoisomerase [Ignavibacteriales bacterium]|nr:1-deoxy-D-xylulose-5-phosphate reductoisomerase [Ignavibacteriales bacterium]
MKNLAILGSTGSIGKNTLEIAARTPSAFRVQYLTAHTNLDLLREQIELFSPQGIVVADECSASVMKKIYDSSLEIFFGEEGLCQVASRDDVDIVVNSLVGFAGLVPTIKAIERGKTVALANKETLVVAGEIITSLVQKHRATIIPIDSEHSAIFQCLVGEDASTVSKIILTASGGPFFRLRKEDLENVTLEEALQHPNWSMGKKITIDSATMMNKGLEVIEAHWLFNLPLEKIEVIIHPQSIIHSMVEFVDGSVKAQLGIPDMKLPIHYALNYPERKPLSFPRANFPQLRELTFYEPDEEKYECLSLAYRALETGGIAPTILNAANEVAVQLFLENKIRFLDIPALIKAAMELSTPLPSPTIEQIISSDKETRKQVLALYNETIFTN